MGLATWKERFVKTGNPVADSLLKWEGLRFLKAYGLKKIGRSITDGNEYYSFTGDTCALCIEHPGCHECPLFVSRDYTSCDMETIDEESAPYNVWRDSANPGPMIKALKCLDS